MENNEKPKSSYGPNVSASRARLPEKYHELFDWSSDVIRGGLGTLFASMLQAGACKHPEAKYWELVEMCKGLLDGVMSAESSIGSHLYMDPEPEKLPN